MKKKVITILVLTLLLLEGTACLLSEKESIPIETTANEFVAATQLPFIFFTLCGEGNGGGGNPG